MEYVWRSTFETGNDIIDNQHKQLFATLNTLFEAYRNGEEKQGMKKALDFMVAYTLQHFDDEEKLQEESDYPEYSAHKKLHAEFRKMIEEFAIELTLNGPLEEILIEFYTVVHDWLVNHIKVEDLKIAQHILQKNKTD
ncbi:MAG: hemerythrin family protein [Syntrophorhabdaceae bacterium]|nr:hemerythrin family protein [Syntrophorhabdaceae bacterium]